MRSVKVMLLGIGLILVGIFFRLWSISYVYSEFVVHHLPIAAVAAGRDRTGGGNVFRGGRRRLTALLLRL